MSVARKDGYNPIRHDCNQYGCYLTECHPRMEWFANCFKGKISFSDIDFVVEVRGRGLIVEWKGHSGTLRKGQEIMWSKFTRGGMRTTIEVHGDPKTMEVSSFRACKNGKWGEWEEIGTIDFWERVKAWGDWAETHPVFSITVNGKPA